MAFWIAKFVASLVLLLVIIPGAVYYGGLFAIAETAQAYSAYQHRHIWGPPDPKTGVMMDQNPANEVPLPPMTEEERLACKNGALNLVCPEADAPTQEPQEPTQEQLKAAWPPPPPGFVPLPSCTEYWKHHKRPVTIPAGNAYDMADGVPVCRI